MIIIDKINYKLINFALILVIFFFIIITKNVWINIFLIIKKILTPIIISFTIAYFFNTIVKMINFKNKNHILIKILILIIFLLITIFLICLSFPLIIKQLINLSSSIISFSNQLFNNNYFEKISFLKPIITDILTDFINNLSSNSFSYLFKSIDIISNFVLICILSIYFLFKMEDIREKIKYYVKDNEKLSLVIKNIDNSLSSYLKSIFIITIIETIEYTIIYFLIGHPNFLLIGVLAGFTTIIPYFGALFTNIIALVTASNNIILFLLSSLVIMICPIFDSYIIDPKIYHKNINISPIATILSIIVCSNLFGIFGIVIAIPSYIVVREIGNVYFNKYFK